MRIYLDTEFIDNKYQIELISIALVKEDGSYYYAISSDFEETNASEWVQHNVLPQLEAHQQRKSVSRIKEELSTFIGYVIPEFWAYFGVYDWVLLLQMYGGFNQLPYNFPFYCKELKQEMDRLRFPDHLVPQNTKKHHALHDAFWNFSLHKKLIEFEKENPAQ